MQAMLDWLENPEIFRVNRLDAHSDHHFYETEEEMRKGRETLRQSLNGEWGFQWSRCPAERPVDFYREGADLSAFGTILVPGHMELQGYGQIQYINTTYPWEGHAFLRPPYIDWEDNPTGSYVKEFDLDEALRGKRVCISFQGVESAMYVWLNGEFVGYAEDTFTPSEFDLTELIREKGNRLCVRVYKRSSASWLEDQDFFRFSGIFREVYLYAKPPVHVEDLWVKTGLTDDYKTGTLTVETKISGDCARAEWTFESACGAAVAQGELRSSTEECKGGSKDATLWISEPQELTEVHKWHMTDPYLYHLVIRVYDAQGVMTEIVPYEIGFRRFEMRDRIMLLNGERIIINGVNRHEWNPRRGRAITEADMLADIEVMKRNHINAVRTCHYPDQSLWYQLCDRAGICVMDETNLETHGSWQKSGGVEPSWNVPGSKPEWKACVLDRAASMLERDKNHASILWWSCGNESYAGEDILAMSQYFHEKDPSRIVHYEGVFWNREFEHISDVESRMYATPWDIREYLENDPKKPFILCEYMHDMGNSLGGMESYIRLLDEFPMYQGGFIWDYKDQALFYKNQNGEEVLGYGGDFGERPTDYAFSGNGIVFADGKEKPAMQEVSYWYSDPAERQRMDEENRERRDHAEQELKAMLEGQGRALQVIHSDLYIGVKGEGFHIIFSILEGPISIRYEGEECIYRAPRPAFWRAATENDKGCGFDVKSAVWMAADQFSRVAELRIEEIMGDRIEEIDAKDFAGRRPASEDIEKLRLTYTYSASVIPELSVQVIYTVDRLGRIHTQVKYHGIKGLPQLPLFGLRFVMPKHLERIHWQGLSGETYPDRKAGASFGIYEDEVRVADYLLPQENQNHADTCWARLGKLKLVMDQKAFHFSAIPYTPLELENALHKEELSDPLRTVVTVLGAMRGVGGIDSWGSDVEPAYHVSAEEDMEYSFYMMKS